MRIGSLVECIKNLTQYPNAIAPEKGKIYTVREFVFIRGRVGLRFEEIFNTPQQFIEGYGEESFAIRCFREVLPPMGISIEEIIKAEV